MLVTIPLYILRELCKAFAMSLLIYSFVFLVLFCGEVVRTGVTLAAVLEIVPYIFPLISRLVLPLSIITGILISYGRFAANNEFIAAQASGIHPFWLGVPGLVIAFFSSIITIYLNADVMTGAVISMERRILADRTNIINSKLEKPGSFSFRIPGSITFAICRLPSSWGDEQADAVRRGSGTGIDFAIFKQPGNEKGANEFWDIRYPYPETRILAKDHQIKVTEDDEGNMTIVGDFWDAIETSKLGRNIASIQTMPHTSAKFIHPNTGFNVAFDSRRMQYMGIDKLKLEREKYAKLFSSNLLSESNLLKTNIQELLRTQGRAIPTATAAALQLAGDKELDVIRLREEWAALAIGDPQKWAPELKKMHADAQNAHTITQWVENELIGADAEIHVKLVMSFACISFAFFSIPLAMLGKRDSSTTGFAIGFAFAFLFYMLITAIHGAVRDEELQWYALWVPNFTIMLLSGVLWYKMTRQLA